MTLNEFAATVKRRVYEDLVSGREPSIGEFDGATLREARTRGVPKMGSTTYDPQTICFEFIYNEGQGSPVVLSVKVAAKERIVFMPVPSWVVENIWQGDVQGSHHFETDAMRLIEEFSKELARERNANWFGKQSPKRRE